MFLCVHCLKENVACTQNGQCCKGQCVYGRCKKEGANGKPGTFCDRHEDCTDPAGTCCVRYGCLGYYITMPKRTSQSLELGDGTICVTLVLVFSFGLEWLEVIAMV